MSKPGVLFLVALGFLSLLLGGGINPSAAAPGGSRFFPETGHTVRGLFLQYWDEHGGLAQQGYPVSDEFQEVSPVDGKTYTVQYFERAVFEQHPENAGTPYEVLLSLLGGYEYQARYGPQGAPDQRSNQDPGTIIFPQTGKRIGGTFRAYWESHGGLAQQGYPITDEFQERSALDGKTYTVQYFERAVFEWHPENKGTPYEVLLSQLGTYRYSARHGALGLPPPGPGRIQLDPHGSDRYLVWIDVADTYAPGSRIIRGFDLTTRRPLTVTDTPGEVYLGGISGATVVWEDRGPSCPPACAGGNIRAKDLATGQTFDVENGPNNAFSPAIAGRTVVWLEANGYGLQVLAKDLDQQYPTPLATVAKEEGPNTTFAPPLISDQYIVWTRRGPAEGSPAYRDVTIDAYNRQTRDLQTIARYRIPASDEARIALDGQRLVWLDYDLFYADLRTGEQRLLYYGPALDTDGPRPAMLGLRGDVVYWPNGPAVYGLQLNRPGAVYLVREAGPVSGATVAGEWLVWSPLEGVRLAPLRAARLADLFAAGPPAPPAPPVASPPAGTTTPPPVPPTPGPPTASPPVPPTASPSAESLVEWAGPFPATPGPPRSLLSFAVGPRVQTAGHYVMWNWTGGGPLEQSVVGFHLPTEASFIIRAGSVDPSSLVSEGRLLAWAEPRPAGGPGPLHVYDLATRRPVEAPPGSGRLPVAMFLGDLYYTTYERGQSDPCGLYKSHLGAPGAELISRQGVRAVATDSNLVWLQDRSATCAAAVVPTPEGARGVLHLRQGSDPGADIILGSGSDPVADVGFDMSGDYVVWAGPTVPLTLYQISTGTRRVVAGPPDHGPFIRGNTVVWAGSDGKGPTIFGYNIATGTTTPLVRANERLVPNGIAADGVLIYTQGDPALNTQALYRLVGVTLP